MIKYGASCQESALCLVVQFYKEFITKIKNFDLFKRTSEQ